MKKIMIEVGLSEADKHLFVEGENNVELTLEGILFLNNIIGASILLPDKLVIEGSEQSNPFVVRKDGAIIQATANAMAIVYDGYNPIATSSSVTVNTEMYLLNDLMKEVALSQSAGKIVPKGSINNDDQYFVMAINDQLDIAVNIANNNIINAFEKYVENKTYADRLAVSLAQRNALRKLPQFNGGLKNIRKENGVFTATIKIPYYYEKESDIKKVLAAAKSLNANIIACDLIDISDGTIIDTAEMELLEELPVIETKAMKLDVEKKIRQTLAARYKSIPSDITKKAKETLYKDNDMHKMSNRQISILINYALVLMQEVNGGGQK